jgi:hypothetical protein
MWPRWRISRLYLTAARLAHMILLLSNQLGSIVVDDDENDQAKQNDDAG